MRSQVQKAVVAVLLTAATSAYAQPQQASTETVGLEEIVVTAQRRTEALQDVPVAVSAFSEATLERLGISQALDVGRFIPNMFAHNNTGLGTANNYSLRALNNTESIATFDPPVGTYVDDVFIARQNGNNFAFFDIDRIEVLRGPQGTLFGRNTTGGAVNIILKKPAAEFGGFGEIGMGAWGKTMLRGSVDLPASDTLLTKFSAYFIKDDGYAHNYTTGETNNDNDNKGFRAAVRWLASEAVTWDVSVDYMEQSYTNIINARVGDQRVSRTGLRETGTPLAGLFTGEKTNYNLGNDVESTSIVSNLQWETGLGSLEFITGYREMTQKFALDFFNSPASTGAFTIANDGDHEQLSQEIKLSGSSDLVDYVGGVYYFDEDNTTDFADLLNFGAPFVQADRTIDNTTKAWAVYAQLDWKLTDRLTLTTGGRYTDEEKDFEIRWNGNTRVPLPLRVNTANVAALYPTVQNTSLFTPRVALKFDASDDVNFFASATRGFKSGGWNARGTSAGELSPFGPEKVWSYEVGMRSEWLDNRLRANVTAFMSDVEDFQLPSAFVNPVTNAIVFITGNFADLEVRGVEIELTAAPTENLNLFANIGIQDAEYQNLDPSVTAQLGRCQTGRATSNAALIGANCTRGIVTPEGTIARPVRAPDYTASFGGAYTIGITDTLELTPNFAVVMSDKQNVGTSDELVARVESYTTWDVGLTLRNPDGPWSIKANCQNCADRDVQNSVLAGIRYFMPPRTWGVNFKYDF